MSPKNEHQAARNMGVATPKKVDQVVSTNFAAKPPIRSTRSLFSSVFSSMQEGREYISSDRKSTFGHGAPFFHAALYILNHNECGSPMNTCKHLGWQVK